MTTRSRPRTWLWTTSCCCCCLRRSRFLFSFLLLCLNMSVWHWASSCVIFVVDVVTVVVALFGKCSWMFDHCCVCRERKIHFLVHCNQLVITFTAFLSVRNRPGYRPLLTWYAPQLHLPWPGMPPDCRLHDLVSNPLIISRLETQPKKAQCHLVVSKWHSLRRRAIKKQKTIWITLSFMALC